MIHAYKMEDMCIVLDVNSGAVHVFDPMTYNMVQYYDIHKTFEGFTATTTEVYSENDLQEAIEEIQGLIDDGLLYSEDTYKNQIEGYMNRKPVTKALCLHVAHDCNLKCTYCFAGEGEYHGARSLMSFETGKKALEFVVHNSGHRRNLEVDFFGGEPLMNFEVVKQLVDYGRTLEKQYNKNFRFTLTTNGVLLDDEKIAYINENMFNVVLSLDGRKEVNDLMRPTPNKKSSYDIIVPKFLDLIQKRKGSYYLRGTYTKNNLDFSEDVFHMADLGVHEISIEPVVAEASQSYAISEDDLEVLFEQYEKLAQGMIERRKAGKGFNFFHFMIDLSQGPCVYKRMTGCGAGSEYFAITPEGDIYPCHQFVGIPEYKLGHVDTGVERLDLVAEFAKTNVLSKPECVTCWAKFYCSGGCSANSYHFNGTLNGTYPVGCELQKKRTECAIYLKADEMLTEE